MAPATSNRSAGRKKAARVSSKAKSVSKATSDSRVQPAPNSDPVAAYIERIPEVARATFDQLRTTVRSAAPRQAVELISYSIPALRHDGVTLWIAAFSGHCSVFPGASLIQKFQSELKGYRTSKGTVQFPIDEPLPTGLIRKIVRERFAQGSTKNRASKKK